MFVCQVIYLIRHSTSSIPTLEEPYRQAAVQAYEHALHVVFICNVVLAVLNTLVLCFMTEEPMPERKEPATDTIEADV